jgi:hypothetical protein
MPKVAVVVSVCSIVTVVKSGMRVRPVRWGERSPARWESMGDR